MREIMLRIMLKDLSVSNEVVMTFECGWTDIGLSQSWLIVVRLLDPNLF